MNFNKLNQTVTACRKCPRLVEFRENLPKRASFKGESYSRKPTPGFGDENGRLLILGLAPSAHGGNRTGRIFTGDESARFLMKMLHEGGFANQKTSLAADDGLKLIDCYMTAAVKCVPPKNAPLISECRNCFPYLIEELALLKNLKGILALGKLAYDVIFDFLNKKNFISKKTPFKHGVCIPFEKIQLFASYHPSPQNTYTGKLTEEMFSNLLNQIKIKIF